MHRRTLPQFMLAAALVGALGADARDAQAQAKDAEAIQLADDAVLGDYLAMNFEGAVKKLKKGLALCARDRCSAPVVARLQRDLGVVYIAGLEDTDAGRAAFVAALAADPGIELDPDLATDMVTQVFEEARSGGGDDEGPDLAALAGLDAEEDEEVPTSDSLLHMAPPEQALLTPLPLYVELASGVDVTVIKVHYLPPTMRDWITVTMREGGMGYRVELPCERVGSTPGALRYYIEALDGKEIVGFSGSREVPHRVAIKNSLDGEPPALPGEDPPTACESELCPPGLPGCGEDLGGDCDTDEDCASGLLCQDGMCAEPAEEVKPRHHWLSLAFQQDLLFYPQATGVCSGGNAYRCYFSGGVEYQGIPDLENGNRISPGGLGLATQRILLGYEYRLDLGLSVGGKAGFAFGGGLKTDEHSFLPVHLELRVAYALRLGRFEPFAMLAAGLADVDGKQAVSLTQSGNQCLLPDGELLAGTCDELAADNPSAAGGVTQPAFTGATYVDAWRHAGVMFAAAGVGARVMVSDRVGPYLELRMGKAFPDSATLAAAQLGLAIGF